MYKQMLSLLLFSVALTACQLMAVPPTVMVNSVSSRQLVGVGKVESVANDEANSTIVIFLRSADVNLGEQVYLEHTGGENPELKSVRVLLTESDTLVQRDYRIESTETERLRALHKTLEQYTVNPEELNRIAGSVALLDRAKAILAAPVR